MIPARREKLLRLGLKINLTQLTQGTEVSNLQMNYYFKTSAKVVARTTQKLTTPPTLIIFWRREINFPSNSRRAGGWPRVSCGIERTSAASFPFLLSARSFFCPPLKVQTVLSFKLGICVLKWFLRKGHFHLDTCRCWYELLVSRSCNFLVSLLRRNFLHQGLHYLS